MLIAVGGLLFSIIHNSVNEVFWQCAGLIICQAGLLLLLIPLNIRVRKIAVENWRPNVYFKKTHFIRMLPSMLILQVIYPIALISTLFTRSIECRKITYRIDAKRFTESGVMEGSSTGTLDSSPSLHHSKSAINIFVLLKEDIPAPGQRTYHHNRSRHV